MRTLFVWLGAIIITLVVISPFFWLRFLKKKNKKLYFLFNFLIVMIIFVLFIRTDNYFSDLFYEVSLDSYTVYNSIHTLALIIFKFLISVSPFLFLKLMDIKITLIKVIIALVLSVIIYLVYAPIIFFISVPELIGPAFGI